VPVARVSGYDSRLEGRVSGEGSDLARAGRRKWVGGELRGTREWDWELRSRLSL
jgi:hypothetical protein